MLREVAVLAILAAASRGFTPPAPPCSVCFYGPDNLVFDSEGYVYVTDSGSGTKSRILKLRNGKKIADWRSMFSSASRKDATASAPEGIAIDSAGSLFVTDPGAGRILKLSPQGKLLMNLNPRYPSLSNPGHVAVDREGYIYVSEPDANRIQKFSSRGPRASIWTRDPGTGKNNWDHPQAIALIGSPGHRDDALAIEDWSNRRILILSLVGKTQLAFGSAGTEPGQFQNTAGLCTDRFGNIYVADVGLHRVQKFSRSGTLLKTIGNSKRSQLFTAGPKSIAVDGSGHLYSTDGLTIVKYTSTGKLLDRWQ